MSKASREYEVGYGKPPMGSRFTKGRSGNPRGRPRGAQNLATMMAEELNQKVAVRENGRRRTISKRRAMLIQIINKAVSGDARAFRAVIELGERLKLTDQTERKITAQDLQRIILEDTR
jgi:uncharacterized protein DUF5681